MVDIQTQTFPISAASTSNEPRIRIALHASRNAALAAIDALPADILCSGYQHPDFLRAWLRHSPYDPVFVTLLPEGGGPVLLPLERANGRALTYAGERHANANFPVGRPEDIAALVRAGETAVVSALRAARPGAHAILLERQLASYGGVANPFVFVDSGVSPNPALSLSLEGGFEEVLERHSGKRRRKRFRGQERQVEEVGGYRYVAAVEADAVPETLDRFFDWKSKHFEAAGIHDVFADEHVRRFYRDLFSEGVAREPHTRALKAIEVGGEPIAIIGCSTHDGRVTVEFGSYDSARSELSPGDMLFFLAIREAAEGGLDIFDFGIGDEPYKRGWCEIETSQRDTVIPLDTVGRLIGATKAARNGVVRSIKSNPVVWKAVKQLRKRVPLLR
ncbi:MAG: GNAT family N-acetyltransferase [Oricola sp.]